MPLGGEKFKCNGFAFNKPDEGVDLGQNVETAARTLKR